MVISRIATGASCLDEVDAVFLVWTAPIAAAPAAVSQIARHARRVVLLTSPHKMPHPFFQQPNPLRGEHAGLERLIEQSGTEWTFLRPGMFAANSLSWWAPQIRAGDVVRWPYAAAPTAPIDECDIAAVAARALLEPGHAGAEYVLTGPESLSQLDQVRPLEMYSAGDCATRSCRRSRPHESSDCRRCCSMPGRPRSDSRPSSPRRCGLS